MNKIIVRPWKLILSLMFLIALAACATPITVPASPADTVAPAATNTPVPPTAAEAPIPASPTPAATLTITPILEPVTYPLGPSGFPDDVNPLTGLRVGDANILLRRPLAIKVSNFPLSARNYISGLNSVDILWEFYTEFGNTRFLAVFYGQDSQHVGPIRSARILDVRIVPLYDAILVHVQAAAIVNEVMSNAGIAQINEFPASCPAICRDPSVPEGVNSAFGNTIALTQFGRQVGLETAVPPNLDGMVFDTTVPEGAVASAGALVHFTSITIAEWKWDPAAGRYLRYSDNGSASVTMVPLIDHSTNTQVATDNVIVLFAPIRRYPLVNPASGEVWDVNLGGSGRAVFFRDGVAVDGTWKSQGADKPLQFFMPNGDAYPLHPGSTYIAMINNLGTGSSTSTTEWLFYDFH
jgi:hypothetical protein